MLLIGDIHITAKYADAILDAIHSYVDSFPEEKNIIFLGDYMYMFSYDRRALGRLFDLFLRLWDQGKSVYIVAGNHDRIGQQFVYAEGKKIADMLPAHSGRTIRFITSPELHTIEGKEILFFPFTKHRQSTEEYTGNNDTIKALLQSKNTNEQISGQLNAELEKYIQKYKELTIIHHYYIADVKFPGQQALFSYKDIALSPSLLDTKHIRLISGHIHIPFSLKNYFCTGSVRYTSPLELDHHKFLCKRDTENDRIEAQQTAINPYIRLLVDADEKVTHTLIEKHIQEIDKKTTENFTGDRSVQWSKTAYPLAKTTITLLSDTLTYENLETHLESDLLQTVQERSIKKKNTFSDNLSFTLITLDIAQKNLEASIIDRKTIVKEFIMSRYGEEFDKYRTLLDELHILS